MKSKKIRNKNRLLIQLFFLAFSNGYLKGFKSGKIYKGNIKYLCAPGMNCYSCPGALMSCPIGSLQSVINDRQYVVSLYVLGIIFVLGSVFGRLICGYACPFGLIQDLLNKIPFPVKLKKLPFEKKLRFMRYFFLIIFVIILPMCVADITGLGKPWFCKYICPVGTLEGGIPLILLQKGFSDAIGFLFKWKFAILITILLGSIVIFHPFCRYICPLGAIYGLFNKYALYHYTVDESACVNCGACRDACKFDIKVWSNPNSPDCIRCGACIDACPKKCIKSSLNFILKQTDCP